MTDCAVYHQFSTGPQDGLVVWEFCDKEYEHICEQPKAVIENIWKYFLVT